MRIEAAPAHGPAGTLACSECGELNPSRARFCLGCGAPLGATPAAARKTVSVVFADLTGSTGIGERLDPESVSVLLSRYYALMRTVLEQHGARVEKFIGDAVMAVFGLPAVREDDALRAVRAAVAMRTGLGELNAELVRDYGVGLDLRTGVNTGEVVTGNADLGNALVVGDAVNVAARLEQAAAPGEILLGPATYALVRRQVVADPPEPMRLRGRTGEVTAHRLREVLAAPRARPGRGPLVGRDHELGLLRLLIDRAFRAPACQQVTIVGPEGVGKSRLVAEAVAGAGAGAVAGAGAGAVAGAGAGAVGDPAAAAGAVAGTEPVTLLESRCLAYGESITFWPIAEMVRQAAGIAVGDPPDVARSKLSTLLADAPDGPAVAAALGRLILLDPGGTPQDEAGWAVRRLFELLAGRGPLIARVDDAQLGSPPLLAVLETALQRARGLPLVLIVVGRQEVFELRPDWGFGTPNATTLLLEPLGTVAAERLLATLAGGDGLPLEARDALVRAAGGNPLFLEELFTSAIEEGRLRASNGRWEAEPGLVDLHRVPTVHALLAARLDRLPAADRDLLERASVAGEEFGADALAVLVAATGRPELDGRLATLVHDGLLDRATDRKDHEPASGADRYRFRHPLLREVAYHALPKRVRAELHERFADWLTQRVGERAREYEQIIGFHLDRACTALAELGPLDAHGHVLAAAAATRLAAAGSLAVGNGDLGGGSGLLRRAAELWPADEPARGRALVELADAQIAGGDLPAATAGLDEADRIAALSIAGPDAGGLAHEALAAHAKLCRLKLAVASDPTLPAGTVRAEAERARAVFERLDDAAGLARAWQRLAHDGMLRCQIAESERAARAAVGYARRAGDRGTEIYGLGLLAQGAVWGPEPVPSAIVRCAELLEQAAGNRRLVAYAAQSLGVLCAMRDDPAAERRGAEGLAAAEELGGRRLIALGREFAGLAALVRGEIESAVAHLRAGYALLADTRETGIRGNLAAALARALLATGTDEEAIRWSATARDLAAPDDWFAQVHWRGVTARVLARRYRGGDSASGAATATAGTGEPAAGNGPPGATGPSDLAAEAVALSAAAVALAEPTDMLTMRGDALVDAAEVLRTLGRPEEARDRAGQAFEWYRRKGDLASARRAAALAAGGG